MKIEYLQIQIELYGILKTELISSLFFTFLPD